MRKISGIFLTIILCMLNLLPVFAGDNLSAAVPEDVIAEIRSDISAEDAQSWTENPESDMKFEYAAPIYSTIGASKDSGSLADTLEPAGSCCIPAVTAEGDCLGAFIVGSYNGKWEIGSYMIGLDFIAAAEQYGTGDSCLIEIPQLGGDLGFLVKDNGEENYYSILSNSSTAQDGKSETGFLPFACFRLDCYSIK